MGRDYSPHNQLRLPYLVYLRYNRSGYSMMRTANITTATRTTTSAHTLRTG
jgi:hypothetical protein